MKWDYPTNNSVKPFNITLLGYSFHLSPLNISTSGNIFLSRVLFQSSMRLLHRELINII